MSGDNHGALPQALADLIAELADCDRQERIEMLIDLARDLPPLPRPLSEEERERIRVRECQSPVFLLVEVRDGRVSLHADVPPEAPTVRGFVALLLQGLGQASAADILSLPPDLLQRSGMVEILGMQRLHGLNGVVQRLKSAVAEAAAGGPSPPATQSP